MAKQELSNTRMDDARRQGQFEGQVLTMLTEIKANIQTLTSNQAMLDTRTRKVEEQQLTQQAVLERLLQQDVELNTRIDRNTTDQNEFNSELVKDVRSLQDWRLYIMGAAGVVAVVVTFVLNYIS